MERVLADIDTNHGDRRAELLRHSVLLAFGAPGKVRLPVGQEHGRTIPLAEVAGQVAYDLNLGARLTIRSQVCQFCPTSAPLPPCSSHTMMVRCVRSSRKEGE